MQSISSRTIDDQIRHSQHLQTSTITTGWLNNNMQLTSVSCFTRYSSDTRLSCGGTFNDIFTTNKLAPYGIGGRLLLNANFEVT